MARQLLVQDIKLQMTLRPLSTREEDASTAAVPGKAGGRPVAFLARPEIALLLLIPVALYFWFIHQYGVNAIFYDQWDNIALLTHSQFYPKSYVGHTNLSMLWSQHNENRMLFPNLIVLALGALTHFNILTELYLSAVLLVFAVSLIILAHRKDTASLRWILYLPVVLLMLSLGQYEDTLFGFQMAWYLVLLALAVVIFLLDSAPANWLVLLAAVAVAVIGSYSSLQGLLIWPTGLLILLWKHRSRAFVLTWLISAIATTGVYFYHFNFQSTGSGGGSLLGHPLSVAEFFFISIGDVMGEPLPQSTAPRSAAALIAIGVIIVLLAAASLTLYGRRFSRGSSPIGPALICFGILFAVTISLGRGHIGLWAASQSRYVTFDVLILVGCYLCLLERWPLKDDNATKLAVRASRIVDQSGRTVGEDRRRRVLVSLRVLVILLVFTEVLCGVENGIAEGGASRNLYQLAALVAAHARDAPNTLIKSVLYPSSYVDDADIRNLALRARRDHLSFFATSEASRLTQMSLPKVRLYALTTSVVKPTSGAILRGGQVDLVAKVTAEFPIRSVDFEIRRSGEKKYELLHAAHFLYGWLTVWPSTNVPNGVYSVESIAYDASGKKSVSQPVSVTVKN